MIERITQSGPALMDIEEGLDLQHGADPAVAGAAVTGLEQPAVNLLPLVPARLDGIGEGRLVKLLEIGEQPQLQRVYPGNIALIRQRILAGTIAGVELFDAPLAQFLPRQALRQEGREGLLRGIRHQVAVHGGKAHRAGFEAIQEGVELLLWSLATVFTPEAQQIGLSLLVCKLGQIFGAARILVILEQLGAVALPIEAVANDIAHQAYERQVDGLTQGIANGRNAAVVFAPEVVEGVHAATGEESFVRAGGILAIQRSLQHQGQALILGGHQVRDGPAADVVLIRHLNLAQALGRHAGITVVQLGDDLQIGGQHPQLGGRAQLQLAALVDVKRLIRVVGLHPHLEALRRFLEQGEAVLHIPRLLRREQALTKQADLSGKRRISQLLQVMGNLVLQRHVEAGVGRQIEPVQIVELHPELTAETGTGNLQPLVVVDLGHRRGLQEVTEGDLGLQRSLHQRGRNHPFLHEQTQIAVGQCGQCLTSLSQVIGGTAMGNHQ